MKKSKKTGKKKLVNASDEPMPMSGGGEDPMDSINRSARYLAEDATKQHPTVKKIQGNLHSKLKEAIRQTLAGEKVVD